MATNDLMVELQKDSIKLDDDSERKVTQLYKLIEADRSWHTVIIQLPCEGCTEYSQVGGRQEWGGSKFGCKVVSVDQSN